LSAKLRELDGKYQALKTEILPRHQKMFYKNFAKNQPLQI